MQQINTKQRLIRITLLQQSNNLNMKLKVCKLWLKGIFDQVSTLYAENQHIGQIMFKCFSADFPFLFFLKYFILHQYYIIQMTIIC
ncbi:unnamed protein product [Paramecium pentaurelia]|uniref:Uncharacterized protein n=1 Tax=Paramecium pentaurelia TaxID=43138 RepID=A0A8S1WP15_9CILI|nr:unnamed protein product [Paramecium pentaurelia]